MIISLTGTPGTGKTTISNSLKERGYTIVNIGSIAVENNFVIEYDGERDTKIVDLTKIDNYISTYYSKNDIVFVDGHLSHLLKNVEKIVILRCRPDVLKNRLNVKNWKTKKVDENIDAEILDVILCEAVDVHSEEDIFEINTTDLSINEIVEIIVSFIKNGFKPSMKYKIGNVDWSEEFI